MKRACELCKRAARLHCESDQASLCWDCDAKVHSANFLVARHSRNLLCRVCQSPTPWSGAGSKLEPTFSDCRQCVNRRGGCDDEEQAVVENQVSPWSPPPPPASESSFSGGEAAEKRKRMLANDRPAHEDVSTRTRQSDAAASGADSISATPPRRKIARKNPFKVAESPIFEAMRRLHREDTISATEMPEYLTMSDGDGADAVDLNLSLRLSR